MHMDADFAMYRKNAVQGSTRLRNAILRSLGYPVPDRPKRRRFKAPSFAPKPPCQRGRPKGSLKVHTKEPEIQRAKLIVANYFHLGLRAINGAGRRRPVVHARQVAMYAAKFAVGASYPEIGRAFWGRDHTTVIHAVRQVQARLDAGDQDTIRALKAVKRMLES